MERFTKEDEAIMTTVFAVGAVIVCLLQVCLCLSLDEAIMTTVFAVGAVIVCLLQVCLCLSYRPL